MKNISVAIVGGTGYTAVELIRLLSMHPHVTIKMLTSRGNAGQRVDAHFPSLRGVCELVYSDMTTQALASCDLVFFATPHGIAMQHAQALLDAGTKVIDLAADFRLQNTADFSKWYGMAHTEPALLSSAVYGLSEVNREKIKHSSLVGNPGCYPTTVLLGLQPLLAQASKLGEPTFAPRIIIDAKSGTSGAGRKADASLIVSEAADNFKAYAVAGHRHHAEMVQGLNAQFADDYEVTFVPHLLPMIRGMYSTIYVSLTQAMPSEQVQALYESYYADEYFIDVMPANSLPETRSVRASNKLRMALYADGQNLTILVVQDNLVKGAAGQAVQNMNLMFGFAETAGLTQVPVSP